VRHATSGDDAHRAFLDRLRAEARRLVIRFRPAIQAVAEALLDRETMTAAELEAVLARVGMQARTTDGAPPIDSPRRRS
jgi:ATP-dependent Zn protease